jgi:hypothetical protein
VLNVHKNSKNEALDAASKQFSHYYPFDAAFGDCARFNNAFVEDIAVRFSRR